MAGLLCELARAHLRHAVPLAELARPLALSQTTRRRGGAAGGAGAGAAEGRKPVRVGRVSIGDKDGGRRRGCWVSLVA